MDQIIYRGIFYLGLPLLNYYYFPAELFGQENYLRWFLNQGPLISISFALISVIWIDLEKYQDLISCKPRLYLSACIITYAGFFYAIGKAFKSSEGHAETSIRGTLDLLANILASMIIVCIGAFWFLCVAPVMYFINLLAGAPARASLNNPMIRAEITIEDHVADLDGEEREEKKNKTSYEQLRELEQRVVDSERLLLTKFKEEKITKEQYEMMLKKGEKLREKIRATIEGSPKMTYDLTLAQRPVAVTAVLASALLFGVQLIIEQIAQ